MIYFLSIAFILSLLIFIHELGHFLAAKLFGVRVERFSIGFPPRLFGKKIGHTDYCISAIPFGRKQRLNFSVSLRPEIQVVTGLATCHR